MSGLSKPSKPARPISESAAGASQGPEPEEGTPSGQVYIAVAMGDAPPAELAFHFPQSRQAINRRAVTQAVLLLRGCHLQPRRCGPSPRAAGAPGL